MSSLHLNADRILPAVPENITGENRAFHKLLGNFLATSRMSNNLFAF